MENTKASPFKTGINFGAILGICLVIISVTTYLLGLSDNKPASLFNYVVILGIIILGTKSFRDHELNGFISYGQALGTGTLITFFGSIIVAFYTYIFLKFIDPSFITVLMEKVQEQMADQGRTDEEIE